MARNEIKGEWNLFSWKKRPEQKRQARSTICPFARIHLSSDQFVTIPVIFHRIIPTDFLFIIKCSECWVPRVNWCNSYEYHQSIYFISKYCKGYLWQNFICDLILLLTFGPSLTQKKTFSPLWTIVLKSLQNELRLVFISSYFLWNNVTVIRNRSSMLLLILYICNI